MVTGLPNLGPKSAEVLSLAGIMNEAQLDELGPVRSYVRCVLAGNVSKLMLYALLGAELHLPWNEVPADIKQAALDESAARLRAHEEGLLHIVSSTDWAAVDDQYVPDSLASEGFIHCSTRRSILGPANALYTGQSGLVVLDIEADRIEHPILFEDSYGAGIEYPHIYGPFPKDAVVGVVDFPTQADGRFRLPASLSV